MRYDTSALMLAVLALVLFGVLMVFSASAVAGEAGGLLKRQLVFVGVGAIALLLVSRFDYHRFADPVVYIGIIVSSFALLFLVLMPGLGVEVDGARRWLQLGPFRFQPSELAKFALILHLAVKMTENRDEIQRFWGGFVPPIAIAFSFSAMVLLERDLGIPALMIGTAWLMMCVAGVRWRYLQLSALPIAFLGGALVLFAPHRLIRLLAFINPWEYRNGAGWQLIQSYSAFARGGIWGQGMGAGEQKLGYLPAAHTDFIFPVLGEELGLAGTLSVVALFILLAWASYRIATNALDHFGALLAAGIGIMIAFQAAFIMAVTTGLLPTKGLPLPFISYGGTSLIVFMGMVGVLMNIGAQSASMGNRKPVLAA